jgi:hypothetical protein
MSPFSWPKNKPSRALIALSFLLAYFLGLFLDPEDESDALLQTSLCPSAN